MSSTEPAVDREATIDAPDPEGGATSRHVRGSSLLLAGRILALGLDFVSQVLIVRYLLKAEYGAFAVAIAIAALGSSIALLGLERTVARFAPIYEEEGDHGRVLGTVLVVIGTVVVLGLIVVGVVVGLSGSLGSVLIGDSLAISLVVIFVFMSPVLALDSLLVALFAAFAGPRSIFLRRYVIAPVLQLAVVGYVIVTGGSVHELALGLVISTAASVAVYLAIFWRVLSRRGTIAAGRREGIKLPFRAIFGFSLPLLASDLVFVLRGSVVVLLLEALRSTTEVADYRAVLPIAMQCLLVSTTFRYLYTPAASRLYARNDLRELNHLYWRTAGWIAVATFPLLIAAVPLSDPVVRLLFGPEYADAAPVLAILGIGYYVHASIGFNALTLRVFNKVRFMVTVDLATAALSIVASVLLIGSFGAIGAALGTTATLILQNALYQYGLATRTGIRALDVSAGAIYGAVAVTLLLLTAIEIVLHPPLAASIVLAVLATGLLLLASRDRLQIVQTFPELGRVPVLRWLLTTGLR